MQGKKSVYAVLRAAAAQEKEEDGYYGFHGISGFRFQVSGFRMQDAGCRMQDKLIIGSSSGVVASRF